jgi:hypothetical protein
LVNDSTVTTESVLHCCVVTIQRPTVEPPYSPISQILDTLLHVTSSNIDHGLLRELPTAGLTPWEWCSTAADSQVVKCNRSSHQQVMHILPQCKHVSVLDSDRPREVCTPKNCPVRTHSKSVLPDRQAYP